MNRTLQQLLVARINNGPGINQLNNCLENYRIRAIQKEKHIYQNMILFFSKLYGPPFNCEWYSIEYRENSNTTIAVLKKQIATHDCEILDFSIALIEFKLNHVDTIHNIRKGSA